MAEGYDVVCVGGGGAGIMAAVAAAEQGARVAVVSKEPVGYGNTRLAVGLMACSGLPGDTREAFIEDVLAGGEWLGDRRLVEALVDGAAEAAARLESFGHTFIRDSEGFLSQQAVTRAGGHSRSRTLRSSGIGIGLCQSLRAAVEKHGIGLYEDTLVSRLVKNEGRVCGIKALDLAEGREYVLGAKAVVLCTGGGGWLFYPQTSNARTATGDGYALAYEAGAELVDMEQVQAIPFAVTSPAAYRGLFCGEPALAGPYGRILNGDGDTILDGGINNMSRAAVVSRMAGEIVAGRVGPNGGLTLDLRPNLEHEDGLKARDRLREVGMFDVVLPAYGRKAYDWEEPWEVLPTVHFFMGGVRADQDGRTCVPGLFAAGEVMGGVHGGNRLGSVALTEIFVFGWRAGLAAAEYAGSSPAAEPAACLGDSGLYGRRGAIRPVTLVRRLQALLWEKAGLVRNREGLLDGLREIDAIEALAKTAGVSEKRVYNTEAADFLELGFMLTTARLVLTAALLREESRGAHLRGDFPASGGKDWQKNIILRRAEDGTVDCRMEVSRA